MAVRREGDLRAFLAFKDLEFDGRPSKKNFRQVVTRYADRIEDLDAEREELGALFA